MDYSKLNDNELVYMINEGSEDAKDILYEKYYYIADIYIKKYTKIAYTLGVDIKDLRQDALMGLTQALNNYNEDSNSTLKTFIALCVERKIQTSLIKAGRLKNKMLNDALSLEYSYNASNTTLADIISDDNKNNPLERLSDDEEYLLLIEKIESSLGDIEKEVFNLMILGFEYQSIAKLLNIDLKKVDNAIQRIKNKVRKVMEKYS